MSEYVWNRSVENEATFDQCITTLFRGKYMLKHTTQPRLDSGSKWTVMTCSVVSFPLNNIRNYKMNTASSWRTPEASASQRVVFYIPTTVKPWGYTRRFVWFLFWPLLAAMQRHRFYSSQQSSHMWHLLNRQYSLSHIHTHLHTYTISCCSTSD